MDPVTDDGLRRAYRDARWGLIAAAWGGILAFDTARRCLDAYLDHRPMPILWIAVAALSNVAWALYTPMLLWLGRRAHFEPARRARDAAVHVAACVGVTILDSLAQGRLLAAFDRPIAFSSLFVGTIFLDGFSYVAVVAIGHAQRVRALYRARVEAQAALDRELTRARLRALEAQLQPHFLFNALHTVGALVRGARPDDAVQSLATIGDLLRASLADDGAHEIPLADEVALARSYLGLQQLRFGDRLHVALDVAPELARARVPRLILQPLLENAIRHGVERSRAAVELEVHARAAGDRLALVVRDRGGRRDAPAPGQGIGLANTRARLDALYGGAHRLDLAPTDGGGLEVRIELPLAQAPRAGASS